MRDLVGVALVAGMVVHLLVRQSYGSLPALPALAGFTLLVLAVVETVLGFALRARIHRKPGTRPVQPLTAARAVALAKASSLLGAIMTGVWVGVLGYVLPQRDELAAAASDTTAAIIGGVSALLLVGAALWLEYCCRTPDGGAESESPNGRD
ncbi:membrane protein [Longimycelium tulufanense]|uniref:Membrane protein n=1 Tax=Longimycelium tulufanense TaxID=907463 RepID=A0A8J3CBW8_9PSEU|nr:membrane protein [Longimycelium tulufanense]